MNLDDHRLPALAALNDPVRRRLYRHVAAQDRAVSRDDAAAALGVARSVVAFHLDRLADLGLLDVEYRRPPGRSGPGAGRPAKLYRRAAGEIAISVPERHYDVVAVLLARAVEDATARSVPVTDSLRLVAHDYGREIGARVDHSEKGAGRVLDQLAALLAEYGYEPQVEGRDITLVNCPFHALAEAHRSLVCAINLDLISGMAEAAGLPPTAARLEPAPGRCCVNLVA